ncbi:MAG: hypothetical protein WCA23_19485 [Stellaceae bacterium]
MPFKANQIAVITTTAEEEAMDTAAAEDGMAEVGTGEAEPLLASQ